MPINFWIFYLGTILRLLGLDIDQIGEIIWAIAGWVN
jgi:hypothetical protein